ncbi:MAG: outer membrane lipoprotein carrier protein LolA, partial [Candidatus Coatesbacteria bacterium]
MFAISKRGNSAVRAAAFLSVVVTAGITPPAAAIEVETIVENASARYDELTDFSAGLWLITTSAFIEQETVLKGRLYSRKPNRFRIEYYYPSDQTVVFDGTTLYFYNPATNQVVIYPVEGITGDETVESVFEAAETRYDFEDDGEVTLSGEYKTYKLKMTAKSSSATYPTVWAWIDAEEWVARRVDLYDYDGNVTSYRLFVFKYNQGYGSGKFVFEIPDGAEVIRAEELAF